MDTMHAFHVAKEQKVKRCIRTQDGIKTWTTSAFTAREKETGKKITSNTDAMEKEENI